MKIALTRNEVLMISITGLYIFVMALSSVFVNVVLFIISGSLVTMSIYSILRFGLFPFAFVIGAKISNRYNLVLPLIIGLCLITFGFLNVLFAQSLIETQVHLIYVLAIIFGFGEGLFWFSINGFNQLVSQRQTRNTFLSIMGIFNSLAQVVAPLLATLILSLSNTDNDGYTFIFQIVLLFMIGIIGVGLKLQVSKVPSTFRIRDIEVISPIKDIRIMNTTHFLFGLRDSLVLVLAGLLIYNATGGSGSMYSRLLALFAFVNIVAFELVRRYNKPTRLIPFFVIGGALMSVSLPLLVYIPTMSGAVLFGLIQAWATPFYVIPIQTIAMRAVEENMETRNLFSIVVAREIAVSSGRVLGMIFVVVLSAFFPNAFMVIAVSVLSIFPVLVVYVNAVTLKRSAHVML